MKIDFQDNKKIGIALGGGGLLGAYELGVLTALRDMYNIELQDFDAVVGTSVGSIIAVAVLSKGLDFTNDLFLNIKDTDIFTGDLSDTDCERINKILDILYTTGNNVGNIALMLRGLIGGSVKNDPIRELIRKNVDEEAILSKPCKLGLAVTQVTPRLQVQCVTTPKLVGHIADYTIASSSCFPVFPSYKFNGRRYIDGGYADASNGYMLEEVFNCDISVIIDLQNRGAEKYSADNILYIAPSAEVGSFLDTDPKRIKANFNLGYADCLRKIEDRVTVI